MNYVRRAASAVGGVASSAASYIPGVSGYFSSGPTPAPAGTTATNNATRRNRNTAAPGPVPNAPVVSVLAGATPAPQAAVGGGAAGVPGETLIQRRMREMREAQNAKRAANDAKKAANYAAFLKPAEGRQFVTGSGAGYKVNSNVVYDPVKSSTSRANRMHEEATRAGYAGINPPSRRCRATRRHRKAGRR